MDITELIVVGAIIAVIGAAIFGIGNKYVFGNKQIVDLNQRFNVAYVMADGGKFERVQIKAWKDWENSDAIQVVTRDGRPIYTHLANVKLTRED